jgi:hypothetical protein
MVHYVLLPRLVLACKRTALRPVGRGASGPYPTSTARFRRSTSAEIQLLERREDIVSSAERFVRHHKQQTDRAISQAYARLAAKTLASGTFRELLHCVRNRAPRLLDAPVVNGHHPGVEALINLSRFANVHVRTATDWPGASASWRRAVCSLARHMVCTHAVPPVLVCDR